VRLCRCVFKECWRDDAGRWLTSGGFPRQIAALAAVFDELSLVLVQVCRKLRNPAA